MNEEMQTVNHELRAKVDELSRTNNDMKNLLDSTDIATLFLDGELRVRRFTSQATKVIKLIPGDVGRPHYRPVFQPRLSRTGRGRAGGAADARLCRKGGRHAGRALVHGAHHALPHAGEHDRRRGHHLHGHHHIQGRWRAKLRESLALYQAPFERIGEGVMFQDAGGDITFVNAAAERILGLPRERMQERSPADPLSQAVHEDGSPFPPEGLSRNGRPCHGRTRGECGDGRTQPFVPARGCGSA